MKKLFVFILAIIVCITINAQTHERWDVKTITDNFIPNFNSTSKVTVAKIQSKIKIPVKNTQPRLNFEKQIVRITGTISRIHLEPDGDYHIEVTDGTIGDSTFVCEAVDPTNTIAMASSMLSYYKKVRNIVKNLKVGDTVKFTGMMFQDKYHRPSSNRTRNFVEMHPILIAEKIKNKM